MRNHAHLLRGYLIAFSTFVLPAQADDFAKSLGPLLSKSCAKCHGGKEINGEINFKTLRGTKQLLANPKLIERMIRVIDANDMPPEGEPPLANDVRMRTLQSLKRLLVQATAGEDTSRVAIRRLNRFQYNNAVRDLFHLNRDVFALSEKLMTRHSNYLQSADGKMPPSLNVSSLTLKPQPGLRQVRRFPKDLRAAHGFDNQANQLTLSPLLLDSFLRLSVSIVESPDFNKDTVGVWKDFFEEPQDAKNLEAEVRKRLQVFLRDAFRRPVDEPTLKRYTEYVLAKIKAGMPFTDSMKKVSSAALCSPRFLYRSTTVDPDDAQYALAAKLSFFLWGSGPDRELLKLAESGELSRPQVLRKTVDRMLRDPKVERFLDSFPAQWMQLENILAATPDPKKHRFFSLDRNNPASLQMLMEPLLLFDAVFVENRPVVELIAPDFSYRSELLKDWYFSKLEAPTIDAAKILADNRRNDDRRRVLGAAIKSNEKGLRDIEEPARAKILSDRKKDYEKKKGVRTAVDLKPFAAWEFNGDLKESIRGLDLRANGKVQFKDGFVVLNRAFLLSKPLPIPLKAKTLEIWCRVPNLDMRGGGLMGIQGPGDFFDTIVIGERQPRHWISGSNGFSRTLDFPGSTPEAKPNELLHLVMVYRPDGNTLMYRNGKPYGRPFKKGRATFPKGRTSVIFGLRHLPAGGNKYLSVSIDKARLYDRALSEEEVVASHGGFNSFVTTKEIIDVLTDAQKKRRQGLVDALIKSQNSFNKIPPNQDPNQMRQALQRQFDDKMRGKLRSQSFQRVATKDPRYGGIITNAAMLSMTSGPTRTHPIARGAWIIEVIFNDPPPPPPNDVPPLNEDDGGKDLTIREKFAQHRENPRCAACHSRLDPLGFALENYDITGRWRDKYANGRDVDSSGTLMRKYKFNGVVQFKQTLAKEKRRFTKAFSAHLLRFALSRELGPADALTVEKIVAGAATDNHRLKSLIREVVLSDSFRGNVPSK